MVLWIRDLSLKYKFWALNMVTFVTTLRLVLFALHLEQRSRSEDAQASAQLLAGVLQDWPQGSALPRHPDLLTAPAGQGLAIEGRNIAPGQGWIAIDHDRYFATTPVIGAQRITRAGGENLAVVARTPSVWQLLTQHFFSYALAVAVLMLALLAASQVMIRFLLSHLNTLKDVMLHVERSGDLTMRVPLDSRDEVGQMAGAFTAMQAGY